VHVLGIPSVNENDTGKISADVLDFVVGGLLKQSVERIDSVREAACEQLGRVGQAAAARQFGCEVARFAKLSERIPLDLETQERREISSVLPRALSMLDVPLYRREILSGAVLSVGGSISSSVRKNDTF
jgi:hypothetical protein